MSSLDTTPKQNGSFHHIPVIDLKDISSEDPSIKKALAEQVRHACVNVGFFYVQNHGVPEETIKGALTASEQFFSLPEEEKLKLDLRNTPNFKGYTCLLSSNNNPENEGDLHEGFEFGWEGFTPKKNDEKRMHDGAMAGANVWPAQVPGFREAALNYYHAAVKLGQMLFPLFALALNLPEDFFDDKTKNAAAIMRLLHYPPQTGPINPRVLGIGAHTDFECFTILWQEPGIQALQVLNANKEWIDAPPLPGTLVLNIGDQLARWTNDVFKSTIHRATNRSGVGRYSIPLFFGTDYDVRLVPIPTCLSEDRPAKYPVVTAGDYVQERLKAAYGH